jgi:DNA-binding CsgD family transcriptional regulator
MPEIASPNSNTTRDGTHFMRAFLQNRFDLTPAEACLVVHLVRGTSPKSSAKAFGVSYETVRRQVKSILRKTGTHRQSGLVLTVLRAINEMRQ